MISIPLFQLPFFDCTMLHHSLYHPAPPTSPSFPLPPLLLLLRQRLPADKTPPILLEPLPRTCLMRMMPAFGQNDSPFILLELSQADRALGHSYTEQRELEFDLAVLGHTSRVDRYEAG